MKTNMINKDVPSLVNIGRKLYWWLYKTNNLFCFCFFISHWVVQQVWNNHISNKIMTLVLNGWLHWCLLYEVERWKTNLTILGNIKASSLIK